MNRGLGFLALVGLAGCWGETQTPVLPGGRMFRLVYSANLEGEIEPCG